jgi:hypothetical protein
MDLVLEKKDLVHLAEDKYEYIATEMVQSERTGLYGIKVNQPGLYELLNVKEASGDDARIIQAFTSVAPCPKYEFVMKSSGNFLLT